VGLVGALDDVQNDFLNLESLRPWMELSDLDSWAYSNGADDAALGMWQFS